MARNRREPEGRRADSMKGLGVTFYKQGIDGALSRKNPNAVVKPKPRPAATKPMSSGKPGESAMSRAEVSRPTVKAVRDESRMAKAEATRSLTSNRQGGMDSGNVMKAKPSAASSAATRANRQGGMDTGNVMKATPSAAPRATVNPSDKTNPIYTTKDSDSSQAEAYRKRSTLKPNQSYPQPNPRYSIPKPERFMGVGETAVKAFKGASVGAAIGTSIVSGKGVINLAKSLIKGRPANYISKVLGRNTKPQRVDADNVGRPIEELLKRGRGTPKTQPAYARPFPKGKGTYKGKRTPGTYTAN